MSVSSINAVATPGNPNVLTVQLGSEWTLTIDERNSQIVIHNNRTNASTRIWGDPHVDLNNDGTTDFDFWNQTSFNLEGGGKLTFETEPWQGNPAMFLVRRMVITYGNDAMVVNGISQNSIGDLGVVNWAGQGSGIDLAVADGDLFSLSSLGQLTTAAGTQVTNQQSSGITGFNAEAAQQDSTSDQALRAALYAGITDSGLMGALARCGINLMLTESKYNYVVSGTGTADFDLTSLMKINAALSQLGMIMGGNNNCFSKIISGQDQAGQKLLQS